QWLLVGFVKSLDPPVKFLKQTVFTDPLNGHPHGTVEAGKGQLLLSEVRGDLGEITPQQRTADGQGFEKCQPKAFGHTGGEDTARSI
ncbi:MAG: hypothetical protein ACKVHP_20805, partial [Verrucomicrobiales bacterium]